MITVGKLLLHPLAVFAAFYLLPFPDPLLKNMLILNACMPIAASYPLLGQKYGEEGVCVAALIATTIISFFTINGFLWLSGSALPS